MTLKQILEMIEGYPMDISPWVEKYPDDRRKFILKTNYYWGLAAYIDLFKIKHALELGTCTGASAVVMNKAGAKVDTWDLKDDWIGELPEGISRHLASNPIDVRSLNLAPYDMVFVDIDHSGAEEQKWHEKLTAEFHGIVFYDDVYLSEAMLAFWNGIEQEKVACGWHAHAGFGLVRY